ncbi:hypothetical protein NADFUDRAFT_72710 [Nadsonia fulvescens var. elongata DSM 6958]|uniref:Flavo protein WrbA n=1 Tax=Nadsonia fulvescens var. elongata DSM 6958 TaxID=857566 RepID=A0A1E3PTT4_9ASCO|nr:hypothetical protein NADFUDRAFT_72710 [Nadsonia fulvescens var. elongata DSM 6958]
MAPKIAIIYYTTYGHVATLSKSIQKESYGSLPALFKTFFDATVCRFFVSTGTIGGGQEATILNSISILTHHSIIYVPLGYAENFSQLANLEEIHGDSPWGVGTFAGAEGSRQPTALELEVASAQGAQFYKTLFNVF